MPRTISRWGANPDELSGVGGPTIEIAAGAALKIGDVAYISAASTVNKSATAANGAFFAGVVVGGGSDFGASSEALGFDRANVGLSGIVPSGKAAMLQIAGIAYVVAGDAILAGASVGFDTGTAGRVLTNTTSKQIIGIALTAAAAAGDIIKILIQPR